MYVEDMTLEEAWEHEALLREWIKTARTPERREQLEWDLEDVYRRIQELDPKAGTE